MTAPASRVPPTALLLLLATAVAGAAAELCLKLGASAVASGAVKPLALLDVLPDWLGLGGLASGWVWLGILWTVASFVAYLRAVRTLPHGVALAMTNEVQALIPLGAWGLLGEHIGPRRWAGIALVLAGLFVVAQPFLRLEQRLEGGADAS